MRKGDENRAIAATTQPPMLGRPAQRSSRRKSMRNDATAFSRQSGVEK